MDEALPPGFETDAYRIFPYARDAGYPADLLYAVYKAMEPDLERIFYDMKIRDLEGVLAYFMQAILYIVADPTLANVLGCLWFTDIKPYTGHVGVWYTQSARGKLAIQASTAICDFVMEQYAWRDIWGFTPWKDAVRHACDCGFTLEKTFEDMICLRQTMWKSLYVVRRRRHK
jgi:hypothetical protein